MAGQFRFKNNSGTVVAQISASNAGAMSFSGSALDFSSVTTLTLGTTTLTGTASFATTAVSSSYGLNALTGSNAMTASSADTLYVRNNATVLGSITAQTLVVQTVTSSVDFVTGSTRFGSLQANTHIFTGSLSLTGSAVFLGSNVGIGTTTPSQLFEVVGGEIKAGRVDSSNEGGQVSFGRATDNATAWYIDAYGNVASPQLRFVDVTGAAVRMTITGSNVGIGTSSPATFLHVVGPNTSNRGQLSIQSNNASNAARITWYYDTTQNGEIGTTGGDFYALATSSFLFYAGGSQKLLLNSGGDLILGTATAATSVNFDINGVINKAGRIRFQESGITKWFVGNGAASENGRFEIYDGTNGTGVQLLRGATSWTALSDERFKDIIEPIDNVVDKFKNIRTIVGKYKTDKEGTRRNFLIAQDLLKVFPEVVDVDENEENPMGVRYTDLIPVLVKALQELSAKVTLLENK
jgi:hypothetical protein